MGNAIDNSITRHTVPLSHYVWWIVGLGLVGGVAGYISRLFLFETAYDIEFDLRNIIYEHLTRMSFPFYDRVQSGQLISRANSDIRSVQMYLTFAPVHPGAVLASRVVAFGFMLSINVPLAFVAMATMPLRLHRRREDAEVDVPGLLDHPGPPGRGGHHRRREHQRRPRGQVLRRRAAAARASWPRRPTGCSGRYIKDADLRARFTPLVQNLPQVGLALVLLFGGYMVIHGEPRRSARSSRSTLYLVMLQAPFMMLGMLIMMGQRAAASAERIYEILDEQPTIVDRPGAVDLVDCRGDVALRATSTSPTRPTPTRWCSTDFDLHLRPGETVALVGRTGTGKSTVARLLARFYDVTGGAVRIDGHDVRDLTLDEPARQRRRRPRRALPVLGLDPRQHRLRPARTPPSTRSRPRPRPPAPTSSSRELADGYDTVVGERGYTLSGGQRQRIAIARTLLVNPPILVLDDATSAIDVQVEQQIHAALRVLMEGRTTLIIAHRLSTISLADRVVLLDGGRIVADGTHAELLETHAALRRGAGPGRGRASRGRRGAEAARRRRRDRRPATRDLLELGGGGGGR